MPGGHRLLELLRSAMNDSIALAGSFREGFSFINSPKAQVPPVLPVTATEGILH